MKVNTDGGGGVVRTLLLGGGGGIVCQLSGRPAGCLAGWLSVWSMWMTVLNLKAPVIQKSLKNHNLICFCYSHVQSNPSLKLTGDQMERDHTHFALERGDLLWHSCRPTSPIFSTCYSPPNPVYPTKRIETTFTAYEENIHLRTECFDRNFY